MTIQADADRRAHDQSRAPEYGATQKTDTAVEARQGVTGQNVNVVLAVSLTSVVVAFALIYAFFWS
jgi:hypothetical protein